MSEPAPRPAPPVPAFRAPSSDDLVKAIFAGDAAVARCRAMFARASPVKCVRLLLVQAIDPLLLRAVLGPELADSWVTPLERYYSDARRSSPATFLDFDRVWADQRARWQPLVEAAGASGSAQEAAVAPDTAHDLPGRGVDPAGAAARRRRSDPPGPEDSRVTGVKGAEVVDAAYGSYRGAVDVFDPWRAEQWSAARIGSRALRRPRRSSPPGLLAASCSARRGGSVSGRCRSSAAAGGQPNSFPRRSFGGRPAPAASRSFRAQVRSTRPRSSAGRA